MKGSEIPTISVDQMKEVDRLMIEEHGIQLRQMMEKAGRSRAELAARMLGTGSTSTPRVFVLCGSGNNGGGGMVAARHLHNRGVHVAAHLVGVEARLKEAPAHQWSILKRIGISKE